MKESFNYEEELKKKAIERGKHEGLDKYERLKIQGDPYYDKFQDFCLFKLAYYECFKCKLPYFGGMKDCQNN
jgi:E3 ubiquitin-protein ligase MYCBP2